MKKQNFRSILTFVIGAVLLIGVSCKSGINTNNSNATTTATSSPGKPFRVAFNTWVGYSPLVIAKEKGFLKEENVDAEISFLEGVGEKNSALIRGDIDAVGHTADAAVVSAASGVDGQIVFVFDKSFGADGILSKKNVNSVQDLRGKKVALEPGFTGHFFFLTLLTEAGMQPSDVQIVPMETGLAGSTFVSGDVEAAVTWQPWLGKATSRRDGKVLITSADRPGLIIDILYMNRTVIDSRRAEVVRLIRAMGKATDWYSSHKEEGDAIMAKFWKLSPEEQKETVAGMRFMTLPENTEFFGSTDNPGQLFLTTKSAAELWRKTEVINKDVDAKSLIAFDALNEASGKK